VVPKAPSFSSDDEEEKTTIESGGWEDEASTTVEQGEVAEKLRALNSRGEQARRANTSITSTNGSTTSEEPTVDDQRGAAALAMLPPQVVARLVITQGNDSGKTIEVRPGKTYTIGRGIDNDLVLTDIAVSRKHFDLHNENGSWVLADRGSGNGTLINNRLEDAPFMLAGGDMIEIGNTAFRFDLPGAVPRSAREYPSTQPGYEGSSDDDLEPSTMSDKPRNESDAATPPQSVAAITALARPKTLPPPAPLPRPRTHSGRPSYVIDRPGPQSQAQATSAIPPSGVLAAGLVPTLSPMPGLPLQLPQTTLPLPQMANRPLLGPAAFGDLALSAPQGPLGAPPTTIPGQGAPIQPARAARAFSYASAQEISQQQPIPSSTARQMAVVSAHPGRDATSTALVPPMSYSNGQPIMIPQPAYGPPPQLTRRMKMALGAAGLALFAAIATIAIIKGVTGGSSLGNAVHAPDAGPAELRPTVEPIRDPKPPRAIDPAKSPREKEPAPTAVSPPAPAAPARTDVSATSGTATPSLAPHPVSPTGPRSTTSPTASPATSGVSGPARTAPTPVAPSSTGSAPESDSEPAAPTPPDPRAERTARSELPVQVPAPAKVERKLPKRADKKVEIKRPGPVKSEAAHSEPDRTEVAVGQRTERKRSGRTMQDVKNEANALYRAKNFSGAAALLTSSLAAFGSDDAQDLKAMAAVYSQLGKAYSLGMAPGTKPTDALVALTHAIKFDHDVGAAHVGELQERLAIVAPNAAASYMASKEYEAAFQAVRQSESLGSKSKNNQTVRSMLEGIAGDLLRAAQSEIATEPDAAKKKLRQILGIVDAKQPVYGRAQKLLNGS
jgi:pSer/pThr/pTyr-binding forkhead associated (FHA) protein